jgi:TRAP-type C4-dicarboxylate transport system permease small subunit
MKIIRIVSRVLGYVTSSFLILLMMITVIDVFLRFFFNSPITGTTEISQLMMIMIVFPALGWAAIDRVHIRVDLLVRQLSIRPSAVVNSITLLIALGVYIIITWRSFLESSVVNRQTSLIHLPFAPFYWVMSVSLAIFCLAILALIIEEIGKAVKR